jgi:hypothetical protein
MPSRLTPVQWLICIIAAIGFAFDIYELLMLPLIIAPALRELVSVQPGTPAYNYWIGVLFWVPGDRRRRLRPARRLPDRSARPAARADVEHLDLRRRRHSRLDSARTSGGSCSSGARRSSASALNSSRPLRGWPRSSPMRSSANVPLATRRPSRPWAALWSRPPTRGS